jgi:hypothetical protein
MCDAEHPIAVMLFDAFNAVLVLQIQPVLVGALELTGVFAVQVTPSVVFGRGVRRKSSKQVKCWQSR